MDGLDPNLAVRDRFELPEPGHRGTVAGPKTTDRDEAPKRPTETSNFSVRAQISMRNSFLTGQMVME